MKRLWSPWRSRYIQTFKVPHARNKGRASLFTTALRSRDDRRHLVVWRGKHCFVIMNRYPYNSGHLMIVPNRQTRDIQDLTPEELSEIMQTAQRAMKALDALVKPQGYNFGANIGRAAGAGVDDHLHFHVVPRWNGDTNFLPVLGDTKVISEDIAETWKKLRKLL
ncbi:MAG: HIT domain-containing protein [Bacteroidota bacterium]